MFVMDLLRLRRLRREKNCVFPPYDHRSRVCFSFDPMPLSVCTSMYISIE